MGAMNQVVSLYSNQFLRLSKHFSLNF